MKHVRAGYKQVNYWLSQEVVAALKIYQHAHQLDSQTQAAEQVLREALGLPPMP